MTGVASAFSTSHPDVLAWMDEAGRIRSDWHKLVMQFDNAYPDHTTLYSYFGTLDGHVVGLSGDESPGDCWRQNKRGEWVPDRRGKAGKDVAHTIAQLRYRIPPCPGMPEMASTVKRWHHAHFEKLGDEMWASFTCEADAVRRGGWAKSDLDESIWSERPLSAYYLASEKEAA